MEPDESALRVRPGCVAPEPPQDLIARRLQPPPLPFAPAISSTASCSGDRTILAQAITLIESSRAADRELAEHIVEDCLPHSGNSIRVGITGVPGAGKSSVIERLGTFLIGGRDAAEGRRAGHRPEQPAFRRKHSGRQDPHAISGIQRHGVYPAFSLARLSGRRGAAHARGDAAVRSGGIPATSSSRRLESDSRRPRFTTWSTSSCSSRWRARATNCKA